MAKRMSPKKVVNAINALRAAVQDVQGLRGLPNWQYDARVRASSDVATEKLKLIEAELDKGPVLSSDAELRAMLEVVRAKICDTESLLGPTAH